MPAAVYKRMRTAPPVSTPRPTVLPSAYAMNDVSRTVVLRTCAPAYFSAEKS